MYLEPLQIKVTHSCRASDAGCLVTQCYIPEDQNLSKFDLLLSLEIDRERQLLCLSSGLVFSA